MLRYLITKPLPAFFLLCLIMFGNLPRSLCQIRSDTSLAGRWEGTLKIGDQRLRVVFHIAKSDSGMLVGTLDSPDQGAMGFQITAVTATGDSVKLAVAAVGGQYEGHVSVDKSSIDGQWRQMGRSLPLKLVWTSAGKVVELQRPQEPKPPYPYKEEQVSYENTKEGIKLAGTLTYSDSGGPFTAVILITGSGPENRNEEVFGHKPFLVIADYLTRRGIAVLRVDDRGVGGSTGGRWDSYTTADYATDVVAGVDYLKSRSDIDPRNIGLVGHSEGGVIAPMVAAHSKDVAFIVMLAGTGYTGDKVILEQTKLGEEADGLPSEKVKADVRHLGKIVSIVESSTDSSMIAEKLGNYLASAYSIWAAGMKSTGIDSTRLIEAQIKTFDSPWFRYFLKYNPATALEQVRCPVLAMGGTLDLQVPAKENLTAIEEALKRGGNSDYTIKLMPGLNHMFQDAKTGSEKEYAQIEETFSPEVLRVMGDWIVSEVKKK